MYEFLGIIGGTIVVASWYPQMYRLLKFKSSKDISIPFTIIVAMGTLILAIYAYFIPDLIYVLINLAAATNQIIITILAIRYRKLN